MGGLGIIVIIILMAGTRVVIVVIIAGGIGEITGAGAFREVGVVLLFVVHHGKG